MLDLQDKILGSWVGMTVGDALGQSVKGLKPETIKQYFKKVDDFKDVRPYLGKGIKRYRMQGLYGAQTQLALAVCDVLLNKRKFNSEDLVTQLIKMGISGPEGYFGVFRRPDRALFSAIQSMPNRNKGENSENGFAFGSCFPLAVPIALYQQRNTTTLLKTCIEAAMLISIHPWEVIGTALNGFICTKLLNQPYTEINDESSPFSYSDFLIEVIQFCEAAEFFYRENFPDHWFIEERESAALSQTFNNLKIIQEKKGNKNVLPWISENASKFIGNKIFHPTQGHVLTLLPLAVHLFLSINLPFKNILGESLSWGREADKLGVIIGNWLGAWLGFSKIPEPLKMGLVNFKEIRLRGEALASRKKFKSGKDLVEMERGLTQKEAEEGNKFLQRVSKKPVKKSLPLEDLWLEDEAEEGFAKIKEDPYKLRQYEREKSRKKKERRKKSPDF